MKYELEESEPEILGEPVSEYAKLDLNKDYTYWDYLNWHFSERVELIRGKVVQMFSAASSQHQGILGGFHLQVGNLFKNAPCKVRLAPFDVRLNIPKGVKDSTVVQPDLCIICDMSKMNKRGCNGSPDFILEILSPSNSKHDLQVKFELYEEAGVKEYWIADPENKIILQYYLQGDKYIGTAPKTEDMTITSYLFPEMTLHVANVFDDNL